MRGNPFGGFVSSWDLTLIVYNCMDIVVRGIEKLKDNIGKRLKIFKLPSFMRL